MSLISITLRYNYTYKHHHNFIVYPLTWLNITKIISKAVKFMPHIFYLCDVCFLVCV